jgi:hypothetical protein
MKRLGRMLLRQLSLQRRGKGRSQGREKDKESEAREVRVGKEEVSEAPEAVEARADPAGITEDPVKVEKVEVRVDPVVTTGDRDRAGTEVPDRGIVADKVTTEVPDRATVLRERLIARKSEKESFRQYRRSCRRQLEASSSDIPRWEKTIFVEAEAVRNVRPSRIFPKSQLLRII